MAKNNDMEEKMIGMTKLLIEVGCGTEACGDCHYLEGDDGEWECPIFEYFLGDIERLDIKPPRCPECLAAEMSAKATK